MVYNVGLPLLIVKGKFKNLELMSIKDLETFIPFMVKCSINRAGALVVNDIPEWWTSTIPYTFPLHRPQGVSPLDYHRNLCAIVCRCYWYHDAQFLLPFCAKIAKSPQLVALKSNDDDTTSIFYVKNSLHILTFNNENQNYDMGMEDSQAEEEEEEQEKGAGSGQSRVTMASRRCLLQQSSNVAAQPLTVYLCENCDMEFSSSRDMGQHEKVCCPSSQPQGQETSTDEWSQDEDSLDDKSRSVSVSKPPEQDVFLKALKMSRSTSGPGLTPRKRQSGGMDSPGKRWVSVDMCLHKNRSVEFSSYYGGRMLAHKARKDVLSMRPSKMVAVYDSFCHTSHRISTCSSRPGSFGLSVELRPRCKKQKGQREWSHRYCFTKAQQVERAKTIETGLNALSRRLLRSCKLCSVVVRRCVLPVVQTDITCGSDSPG